MLAEGLPYRTIQEGLDTRPSIDAGLAESLVSLEHIRFDTPDRSGLPPLRGYASMFNGETDRVTGYTEASRRCKHLCRHCSVVSVYNGRFRVVPVDIVMADIRQQVQAGARHVTFGDPDFFNGPTHGTLIVERVKAEFPSLTYDVTITIEHLLKRRDLLPICVAPVAWLWPPRWNRWR